MFICRLFMDRDNIALFPVRQENTFTDTFFKNYANGLKITGPQIFNMRMLILLWPCALAGV